MGGFHPYILPEEIFGRSAMLAFRDKDNKDISDIITDMVSLRLNDTNEPTLDTESDTAYPHPYFMPRTEEVQDKVIYTLLDLGFVDIAEAYLFYRSARGLIRSGEIRPDQFPPNGFPSDRFKIAVEEQYESWGCSSLEQINAALEKGRPFVELVDTADMHYENELKRALAMFRDKGEVKFIIIAGPSSSGKTTTTKRFKKYVEDNTDMELLEWGLDNYFIARQPRDARDDMLYEFPESLDLRLIKEHLKMLLDGQGVEVPSYNFHTFRREDRTENMLKLETGKAVVIDSHNGLFTLFDAIPPENKFIIYIEPFSRVRFSADDGHIPRSRYNMLRRWLRDFRTRGTPFDFNIPHWRYVRLGCARDIPPRMNKADIHIDSGVPGELNYMAHLLLQKGNIPPPEYWLEKGNFDAAIRSWQANDLLQRCKPINPDYHMGTNVLPQKSVLREFVGGSCYDTK